MQASIPRTAIAMSKRLDRRKHAACGMPVVLEHPAVGGIANQPFAAP
jgi:hypothetical protein